MANKPEDKAREVIDKMLEKAGWHVCDYKDANIRAYRGVVIRNFPLKTGHGCKNGQDQLRDLQRGATKLGLGLDDIKAVDVPLPPLSEQKAIIEEIDRRLSVTDEIEAEIETNLKRAERLRQSILKKAFSGRLV